MRPFGYFILTVMGDYGKSQFSPFDLIQSYLHSNGKAGWGGRYVAYLHIGTDCLLVRPV